MRDWILENREAENIQFVIHTGDVVDAIGPAMYENAATALVPIFEALPGMIVSGNHDVAKTTVSTIFSISPIPSWSSRTARPTPTDRPSMLPM